MKRLNCPGLAGALMLAAVAAAPAAEFYVNVGNASGTELGTQQSPFRTVQAAIDAAASGDEIRVAAGTYTENLRIQGKRIVLNGGYSSGFVRDVAANTTTLMGAGGNAVINLIESNATIDGFRITAGTGSTELLPDGYHGGGIFSRDGSPTISNNIIEGNDVRTGAPPFDFYFGGGVHVTNAATATIVNNIVRGNFAGRGAGLSVVNAQAALIQGNTIEDNVSVGDHGGGLYIGVVDARITQNIIRRNEVGRALGYGWGAALVVFNTGNYAEISFNEVYENFSFGAEFIDEGATADIHHELLYDNQSQAGCQPFPAIYVDGGAGVGSQATISHVTVVGNVCENSIGLGLQVEGMSTATVTNSIFWNNGGDDFSVVDTSSITVTYTDSQEPFAGTGNISVDPRFVDESARDFHLSTGSPCIDAGDPASPFEDEPAPNGGRADMGRYGNAADTPPPDRPPGGGGGGGGGGGSNNGNTGGGGAGGMNGNTGGGDGSAPPVRGSRSRGGACGIGLVSLPMLMPLWLLSRRPRRK